MNAKPYALSRSSGFYERLISLYPASYRAKHREELLQNFEDLERDMGSKRLFWAFVISDFLKSITQQYMEYIKHHRWAQVVAVLVVAVVAVGIWQFFVLRKAHSSFANYAAFRGCATITGQSATSGTCTLGNGQSITMVERNGKWFLQGDYGW
jgi:hypothetical protein